MSLLETGLLFLFLFVLFSTVIFHENLIYYIGHKLCQNEFHWFKKRKYHCSRCKAVREWPKLKCIQGYKKDRPSFPKI